MNTVSREERGDIKNGRDEGVKNIDKNRSYPV